MEILYPYFLTLHLLCAIIFLGYIFTDVVLLTPLRKILGDEIADKVFGAISKRGVKIMPLCVALLVITGGAMISRYIGSVQGYVQTPLQILLVIKMCLALCIVVMVTISLSCKFLKLKNPLAKVIHPIALFLGLLIVLLAKAAFYI
ncbi:copper resistance protein CopD [Helicobacter sp. MIT 21-1697]|uniref:copper resistance protein CopD n=1 Tax=Helicobacter sp. MIT 21-1697 TaxID=2993733 RepID=UPI00224B1D20|nr:copper resistance protein CopD [Helicobacter sp. MIT 21-1697]MCX2717541.1 copper resistance protein CopD [Helicobacter sp. MIT 21-1697]